MSLRVVVLLENEPYPFDRRVRREAEALVSAGCEVTVLSPTGFGFDAAEESRAGVRVLRYRSPPPGRGALGYLREYAVSLLRMGRLLSRVSRRWRPDVVFVCNPPDFLVLLAMPLARRGAAIVFDHHDLSPELFERKFGRRGILHALLLRAEALAYRRADVVIEPNESYAEIARARGGVAAKRLFLVRHSPDTERFFPVDPHPELRRGRSRLVVWMGNLTGRERVDGLIDAADELVNRRGRSDLAFALVGPGEATDSVLADVRARGLEGAVSLPGSVDEELLRAYLATADVCVSVDPSNPMNDYSTVTKVLDYMTMARPVVQYPLHEMTRICGDASLYARDSDPVDLADKIEVLLDDPQRAERMGADGRRRLLAGLIWRDQVPNLLAAVEAAVTRAKGRRGATGWA